MDKLSKNHKVPMVHDNAGLYQKMVEEVQDYAILLLDIDGNILNWNQGAQKIKGYLPDEIIGRNFRMFYTEEDRHSKLPDSLLNTAMLHGKASHEGWRVKKDGTRFWGSVVITTLHNSEQEVIGFSKLTRDLTERKMAEERDRRYALDLEQKNEELRKSEERYHNMIAEVEDYAIIMLDPSGNILNWNKGAEKIKGYSEKEILGSHFSRFYVEDDVKNRLPFQLLEEARRHNKATHEGWRQRKDRSLFWGSVVITALHDKDNNVIGYSKVTRDLTQKKEFEDRILMQNKQLQEYAYVASHDLQEPLRKIMIFGSRAEEEISNNPRTVEYIRKIRSSAERMRNLITSLLDYSKALKHEDLLADVDLTEVIKNIEQDFEILLAEKSARLNYAKLPTLKAIPIQMHQLFFNLISNALKFNDGVPEISITATVSHRGPQLSQVNITITDNGIGFDPVYKTKIFGMFQRLNGNQSGTGIGLALCKKIIDNHGGTISAESLPGKGARFDIMLPLYGRPTQA